MSVAACSGGVSASYSGALDHYLSPARRDAVKSIWEEPATQRVIDDAVTQCPGEGPLRVLDVGCGIGDALRLLRSAPGSQHRTAPPGSVRYTGIDLNQDLLSAARWLHGDTEDVSLVCDDIREHEPAPFDLCLSTGVPYSHLTPAELEEVLTGLFAVARDRTTAVAIDVLGRYSVEWSSRWDQHRWPYRMSFFSTEQAATSTDMTCYSGAELRTVIAAAAERADCELRAVHCYDRSILVGRHSNTAEFAPGIRPYRRRVNELLDPDVDAEYDDLLFDMSLPSAPPPVAEFFAQYAQEWNALVTEVYELSRSASARHASAVLQPMLAHGLRNLETSQQQGLGVGHSLTAVAYTHPQ